LNDLAFTGSGGVVSADQSDPKVAHDAAELLSPSFSQVLLRGRLPPADRLGSLVSWLLMLEGAS